MSEPPSADEFFDDDMLRSSAVIPAAEELKLVPPAPSTPVVPPPVPRAESSAELVQKPRAPSHLDMELRRPPSQLDMDLPRPPPADLAPTPLVPPVASSVAVLPPVAAASVAAAPPATVAVAVSPEAQAQLFDVLRAVLDATLAPLLSKQQELEARLETLQRAARAPAPSVAQASHAPLRSIAPSIDITGSLAPTPAQPRAALIMTSYGPVSVMPTPAPRPAIEAALENVGSFEMPDFAGKRKFAGRIIIGILIVGVITAIVATVLSYS